MKQFTLKQLLFEIGNVEHEIYKLKTQEEELEVSLFTLNEMMDSGEYKEDKNEQN